MPKPKTIRRDVDLENELKKYTDKGWSAKTALTFLNGDKLRKLYKESQLKNN